MDFHVVEQDAREFGLHVKQGGWRLGLLVARSVEAGNGQTDGLRKGLVTPVGTSVPTGKVSAQEFARQSGTSHHRVLRYLDAWERAATAGLVPGAVDLEPGQELDLDVEALPEWEGFYRSPVGQNVQPDRREALFAQAKEDGVGASKVIDIASNPKAMASAIKADPAVARAAALALANRPRTREERRQDHDTRSLLFSIARQFAEWDVEMLLQSLDDVRSKMRQLKESEVPLPGSLIRPIDDWLREINRNFEAVKVNAEFDALTRGEERE